VSIVTARELTPAGNTAYNSQLKSISR